MATSDDARSFETTLTALDADGRESAAFATRQTISWVLVVRNTTLEPQVLQLPTAQMFDVALADASGRELWRWSAGRMFAQVLTELALDPGESKRFEIAWDQRLDGGVWIAPGRYRAIGSIPGDAPGTTSPPTEVTIR